MTDYSTAFLAQRRRDYYTNQLSTEAPNVAQWAELEPMGSPPRRLRVIVEAAVEYVRQQQRVEQVGVLRVTLANDEELETQTGQPRGLAQPRMGDLLKLESEPQFTYQFTGRVIARAQVSWTLEFKRIANQGAGNAQQREPAEVARARQLQ